jgi:hypothetical protein
VYYKVERIYLTNAAGESDQQTDNAPYFVSAADAPAAAASFVNDENGRLLGTVSAFSGDKAAATAWREGRLYTIFVQRGAESINASGAYDEARR